MPEAGVDDSAWRSGTAPRDDLREASGAGHVNGEEPGVRRNRWGIPHVVGGSADEVAHLQGRSAVVDRSWQLEHSRLVAEGHEIPVARVQAMHEGKRRARARRTADGAEP